MKASARMSPGRLVRDLAVCLLAGALWTVAGGKDAAPAVAWEHCLCQADAWYGGAEAVRIADNVLFHQFESGGWDKNVKLTAAPSPAAKAAQTKIKKAAAADWRKDPSTIDNGAGTTQLRYLARVTTATRAERFRQGFLKGLDLLLAMQYANGGWPQCAFRGGYHRHVTFNDDATINVLRLLREVSHGHPPYAFVDAPRRERTAKAVQKGIQCILKCQVRTRGKLTVWCAQYDEHTLAPASARKFEKAALSGAESVEIVKFLMGIRNPSPEVIRSIEGAVAWFKAVRIDGLRVEKKKDRALARGFDLIEVRDPGAPPLWARFYQIGGNQPIFCGRDGIVKYRLADIEYERRTGYAWYGDWPARLLAHDYPAWRARWVKRP